MDENFNKKFDLDEILEETNKKKNKKIYEEKKERNENINEFLKDDEDIKINEKQKKYDDEQFDEKKDIYDEEETIKKDKGFNINIDFNKEDLLIDEALLENENVEDDDIIKNFFKKENKIKYNFEDNKNYNSGRYEEESVLLNQKQIFGILKDNKKYLIKKFLMLLISFIMAFGSIIFSSMYDMFYEGINIFSIINVISLLIAVVSCNDIIMNGFKALFKSKGSFEAIISLACLAGVTQSTLLIFNTESNLINSVYSSSIILILLFNIFSKYQLHRMMKRSSRYISVDSGESYISYASSKNLLDPDEYQISCFSKEVPVEKKDKLCYSNLRVGNQTKTINIYLILLFCILVFGISFFKSGNLYLSVTSLCCILILSYPLSKDFCFKYVVNKISKRLYRKDVLLYKYSALDKIEDCSNLIISNKEFFNTDSFRVQKIKVFDYNKINDSIINVTSLLQASHSLMSKMFLKIIGNKISLIKEVNNIEKDPNKGLKGIINNQEIIFGTSDYLLDNNIVIPSKYVNLSQTISEDKSLKTLYVAIDGLLTAMFLIKMKSNSGFNKILKLLVKNDLKIITCLDEPFICSEDVEYIYNIDKDYISSITPDDKDKIEDSDLGIFHNGKFDSLMTSVIKCIKIKQSFRLMFLLELVGILMAVIMTVSFVLLNMMSSVTYLVLMLIQIFWFGIIFLISYIHN